MKKFGILMAMLGVIALAGQAWAGSACCAMKKADGKAAGYEKSCSSALSGMDLTQEQQDKIAKIEESCKASGSTVEACSKSMSEIRDVLTADQKVAFDAAVSKMNSKQGCGG